MKLNQVFALFLVFCGLVALYMGGFELPLWLNGNATPSVVTLEELGSSATPSNVHVTITDFEFSSLYVVETSGRDRDDPKRAWLPLNLQGSTQFSPEPLYPVIVLVDDIKAPTARLQDVTSRTQLTGIITSGVTGIREEAKNKLLKATKQNNLSEAIVLEIDRPFPELKTIVLTFLMAIAFFGVAAHAAYSPETPTEESPEEIDETFSP
ncbi:hypothetical protein [Bremerella alba]|uniref:Uncharacterized protein n=1 Tax=Bremerella alba TaxID=980252 RepID=A0A7V9A8I9_9BACT|nr:hypothetical protein [Bremerella alba]MBA2116348.1 hypothetical protein [Bremerella alba]